MRFVEKNSCKSGFLLGTDALVTERVVLVLREIVNERTSVIAFGNGGDDGGAVGRPIQIVDGGAKVEAHKAELGSNLKCVRFCPDS